MNDSSRAWLNQLRGWLPRRETLGADLVAGLPGAISSVPDGMASGLLAGVNPVHGLYASVGGRVAGGIFSSSTLMIVTTTSAASLAAGSALSGIPSQDRDGALGLLTLIAGVAMLVAGFCRLGRYTRFVSHSVMTGFLTGVAVNIVLGQLPDLVGASPDSGIAVQKALSVVLHPGRIDLPSLLVGLSAAAIIVLLGRTPLGRYSALIALVVPTAVVLIAGLDSVAQVDQDGAIPPGFPLPGLPDFRLFSFGLLAGALSVAAIVLVQGAGVAESAPNPSGLRADADRDFQAQGAGNVIASVFRGMPVGGSVGMTALNVASGARSRWAAIFSGLWLLLMLLVLSPVIGYVAQPTLAALLMVSAVQSIRAGRIITILRTGVISEIALVSTFIATLLLPVATAVAIGVVLSLILQLNRDSLDLRVVQLTDTPQGWVESHRPRSVPAGEVVVLDIYGSLLFAGARTLQAKLPDPIGIGRCAVVIRLRGRTELGATFFAVVEDYAVRLKSRGGRMFLSGVDPHLAAQYRRSAGSHADEYVEVFAAESLIGHSTGAALERARQWLGAEPADEPAEEPEDE